MKPNRLVIAAALALATPATAQPPAPSQPPQSEVAMTLDVDASDVARGIYRVTQTFPVAPGTQSLELLYPEWIRGNHGPRGPIAELVGLEFSAGGNKLTWRRDPQYVFGFIIDLPPGTREVTARFVHTSPLRSAEGRVTMTAEMLNLQWEKVSLYPAGRRTDRIAVRPSVTLPAGWTPATSLPGKSRNGDRYTWSSTDYETLSDSPIFAGVHFRQWPLGKDGQLNVVADTADFIKLTPDQLARFNRLMDEAQLTFGKPPFERYDFLIALSDRLGSIGIEHLSSTEIQLEPRNFASWDDYDWDRNVVAHELAHAWNGKSRRPKGLSTPDFRTPQQGALLWVYEGQTQFWGAVLAARSGLQSKQTVLDLLARMAAHLAESPGRAWRPLADTTGDPVISARKPKPYDDYALDETYYYEGAMIWLEADQIIRAGTRGKRGLDDFARGFFAHSPGNPYPNTYDRADLVAALNATYAYDWEAFFADRVDRPGRPAPIAGIEMGGYRLVWKETPNPSDQRRMDYYKAVNLTYSIGFVIDNEGVVSSPLWQGPAFRVGIVTGAKVIAVGGLAFTPEGLRQAITRAKGDKRPIALLVKRGNRFDTVEVPYFGGLRWPWLEPKEKGENAPLDRLLAPRTR